MTGETSQAESGCRTLHPSRNKGRRVRNMLLLWAAFGLIVGIGSAPGGGLISTLSGALAGVMVLPWLGLVLGLIGGGPKLTLLGGIWGLIVGALAGALLSEPDLLSRANLSLILGALVGATFPGPLRLISAVVARILQSRANSPAT
jgi:hypothetical protein